MKGCCATGAIRFLVGSATLLFALQSLAGEVEQDLGTAKARNVAKIIKPGDVKPEELRSLNKVAVLVTSGSPFMAQVAQDVLTLKFRDAGFEVVEETRLSEATLAEINKYQKEQEKPDQEKKKQEEILNLVKIAKTLGLQAVVAGTVFEGRKQTSFPDQKPPTAMEKLVVSTCYVQVISVSTGKPLFGVLLEYDMGENLVTVLDQVAKFVTKEMGK